MISCSVFHSDLDRAAGLLADIAFNPAFTPAAIDSQVCLFIYSGCVVYICSHLYIHIKREDQLTGQREVALDVLDTATDHPTVLLPDLVHNVRCQAAVSLSTEAFLCRYVVVVF